MSKTCVNCTKELPLDAYTTNKRYKDGLENRCRDCINKKQQDPARREANLKRQKEWCDKNKDYQKNWRKDNPEYIKYKNKYYEEHKDQYKQRKKEWRKKYPARETEARQKYSEKNRDRLNKYHSEWKANKRVVDICYKVKENMSRRIRNELTSGKSKSTCNYLGCSIDYLKIYLEARFLSWMNWENYGKSWHIDHIIPCKAWDLTKEFDNYCCWNYRNLQPLNSTSNHSKKDKYDPINKLFYETKMQTILF